MNKIIVTIILCLIVLVVPSNFGCLSTSYVADEMSHRKDGPCSGDITGFNSIIGDLAIGYAIRHDKDNNSSENLRKGVSTGVGIIAGDLLITYLIHNLFFKTPAQIKEAQDRKIEQKARKEIADVINKYIKACLNHDYKSEQSLVELSSETAIRIAGINMYKSEDEYKKYLSLEATQKWCNFLKESAIDSIKLINNTNSADVVLISPKNSSVYTFHIIILSKNKGVWRITDFTTR